MDEQIGNALWSVEEVSTYLRVPVKTIYSWRSRGLGPPAFRVGRYLRFRSSDVENWLAARRDPTAVGKPGVVGVLGKRARLAGRGSEKGRR